MRIKKLKLKTFRNYKSLSLDFNSNTNIFIGNNAQGKTNILESIYVLAFTKSHKNYKDSDLIYNSADFAKINALINLKDKDIELDMVVSKLGKKAKHNQIELTKLSEYIGLLNVVMFAPEDLELIKGNPKTRRKFLDIEIGQISKEYIYNLQNYRKVLKQRNDLLKSMQKKPTQDFMLLDVITDQLVGYQIDILKQREKFLRNIEEYAKKHYQKLSSSEDVLRIEYIPSIKNNFKEEYISKYQYDIITGTTNLGVHRDEIDFYINEFPIKSHASQGEQRTAVLAVKLALIDFIYFYKKDYPVLLLDDVLSELDKTRQNNLLEYIDENIQTFITSTEISDIDLDKISDYQIYTIEKGHIKESDNHEE
jgi:DNA replication and repair protein RecF